MGWSEVPNGTNGKTMRSAESKNAGPGLRVILVGRTGLDGALRQDPGLELVRVKNAVEAVGEVADPFEVSGAERTVVIVAAEAEPAAGPDEPAPTADHAAEFLRAMRMIDPKVRVLRVGGGDGSAIYDGTVRPDMGVEQLREAIRGEVSRGEAGHGSNGRGVVNGTPIVPGAGARGAAHAPPLVPPAVQSPGGEPGSDRRDACPPGLVSPGAKDGPVSDASTDEDEEDGRGVGDESLVRRVLRGHDPETAALALIRRRLGGRVVRLVGPEGAGVAVAWDGKVRARLAGDEVAPAELTPHAVWLAGWLRLRDQQAQLREAAFTDPATGAYNRRFCERFLSAAISGARQRRLPVTILYFDVDNFKMFNDRYGHAAGDLILREIVRMLRAAVRPTDRVCRVGGDEFVVIFNEPDGPRVEGSKHPTSVFQIARRFQQQILEQRFPKLGIDAPGTLTISGGLATFPWDGATPEALVERADQLALESKRQGKNVITIGPGALTQGR